MKDEISSANEIIIAEIDELIVLAHILDKFEQFNSAMKKIMTELGPKKGIFSLGMDILKISENEFIFQKRIKRFYTENEETLKPIMQYSNIIKFLVDNYNHDGQVCTIMKFFYQYMMKNRNKLGQILTLLEHLKKLGFNKIQFDTNLDKKDTEYTIKKYYQDNIGAVTYSDGIQIVPTAVPGLIKYKIVGGNYVMDLSPKLFDKSQDRLMNHSGVIIVKNLLFDVRQLPENLSKRNTFDRIMELYQTQIEQSNILRESIHLSILTDNFHNQYEYGMQVAEMIKDTPTKEGLLGILEQIRIQLEKMQSVSTQYDAMIQDSGDITEEQLKKEKKFYLQRLN